jgi:uncharacterized membrane protein (DUF2068 family)
MAEEKKSETPAVLKKRAPLLYFIIVAKLIKGTCALALAFGIFKLAKQDLPDLFDHFVESLKFDPENRFLSEISDRLGDITSANVKQIALGTFLYSLFSLVEGVGLIFRVPWAGWLAIGESAFFIPIELSELIRKPNFSWIVFSILLFNIIVVWYLFKNRAQLFKHHHH